MKKQIIDKAYFLINAVLRRLEGGEDFFESLDVRFKTGMKTFDLRAVLAEDGRLSFFFSGEPMTMDAESFAGFIAEKMADYEEMTLAYNERGKRITVFCDAKDAKMSSSDIKGKEKNKPANIYAGGPAYDSGKGRGFDGEDIGGFLGTGGSTLGNREYIIKAGQAGDLLRVIGIVGSNGKIRNDRIRKYNQIDHFVELIAPLLDSLCAKNDSRPVRIIDCACGKSYLSFVLNYYIKEIMGRKCFFTGLDYNPTVIEASKKMATELGYRNMEFVQTDIGAYEPDVPYDLLLTLHACDTATDKALNFAIKHDISHIVCVPCCHREMNSNYSLPGFEPVMKYGILKARIADCLTDALRAEYLEAVGYDVSIVEYISPLDTPKNLMMRAEKKHRGVNKEAMARFEGMVKALGTELSIGK